MLLIASYFLLELNIHNNDDYLFSDYLFSKEATIVAQTDNSTQGQILQQGTLLTLKAGIWVQGQAVLTTERFYRQVKGSPFLYNFFGLLGSMINNLFPTKTDIDIQLTSITEIGRGKVGLKKDVLYIRTMDGKSYQFTPHYDFWIAGLKDALEGQGATLVQNADERWSVQR
jgi:hypothetical protein